MFVYYEQEHFSSFVPGLVYGQVSPGEEIIIIFKLFLKEGFS
ncbi:MAG: hypothetical protein WBL25_14675 [Anaerolineales bacterium]